jgi:hypothetical protein
MKILFRIVITSIIGAITLIFIILWYWIWGGINSPKEPPSPDENSCKLTGGQWEIDSCGSACWEGYHKTKSDRIKYETQLTHGRKEACIMSCSRVQYCECPEGQYFWSSEEWCIPNSEKAEPDKKEVEAKRKAEEAAKQDDLSRRIKEYKSDWEYSWKNLDWIKFLYSSSDKLRYYGSVFCTSTWCTCASYIWCVSQFKSDTIEKISSKNIPKSGQISFPILEITLDDESTIENPKEAITQVLNGRYNDYCKIFTYNDNDLDTMPGWFAGNQNYEFYIVVFVGADYTSNSKNHCSTLITEERSYREDKNGRIISGIPMQYFMYSKKSKRLLFINQSDEPFVIDPSSVEF